LALLPEKKEKTPSPKLTIEELDRIDPVR